MLAAIGLTRGVRLLALLGLGAVLVGLGSLCVFTVDAGEYAVVTQFGKPVRVESTPGLKFKLPAPVQTVSRFDRRLFVLVPPPREFPPGGRPPVGPPGFLVGRAQERRGLRRAVSAGGGAGRGGGPPPSAGGGAPRGGPPFPPFGPRAPGGSGAGAPPGGPPRQ